ncbi:TIPRL [Bugula neritina]|uniref:TIP41-like protein n=1 Tax=Bugula neritina TaxID=10212 RepID=A0A7J7JY16_BUGNE|nr:TIPRL [Bugula neritina]
MATAKHGLFSFGNWDFNITESHILKSDGPDREAFEKILSPLPQTPEMTYDQNILRVTHTEGFGVEFSALDALKLVNAEKDLMKVAVSEAWKSSRDESQHIHEVFKPFDWTFSTTYSGTLINEGEQAFTGQFHKVNKTV